MSMGFPSWSELLVLMEPILSPFGQWLQVLAAISVASYLLKRIRRSVVSERTQDDDSK